MPEVVAICAVARNGVIGVDNELPWRLPGDLPRLKRITAGHVLIMGRRTFESLPRPMAGRTSIVLTRDPDYPVPVIDGAPVYVSTSIEEAFDRAAAEAGTDRTVFVFGGGEIYRASWDRLDRLEITEVDQLPAGDVTFPHIDPAEWQETNREAQQGFDWVGYRRIR